MKQLIELIRLGALAAFSVSGKHRQIQAPEITNNHHFRIPALRPGLEAELVLLDIDGTVIAREVNLGVC
jgi:hypothetical protein